MKHLSDEQVQKFRERSLTSTEFTGIDQHLAECEQCRTRLVDGEGAMKLRTFILNEPSEDLEHLNFEQIAAWAEDSADPLERRTVDEHLQHCAICSREVEDLKNFRNTMKAQTDTIIPFEKRSRSNFWMAITAIAAIIAIASTIAINSYRARVDQLQARLKNVEAENERLRRIANSSNQQKPAIIFQDGSAQVSIAKDGEVVANLALSKSEQEAIREAVTKQQLDMPEEVSRLISRKEVLMGSRQQLPFSLIAPVGTAVASDRPEFRWEPLPTGETYQVRIFDPQFHSILESPKVQNTKWVSPEPLPAGIILTWQVAAQKKNEEIISPVAPFPDAKFYILTAEERQRLNEIREKYVGFHLLLGVEFTHFGLLDDAEKEFIALKEKNPQSNEAARLLENLRKIRNPSQPNR